MLTLSQAKLEFNDIGEQYFEGLISFDEMMTKILFLSGFPIDGPIEKRWEENPYTDVLLIPVYRDSCKDIEKIEHKSCLL